MSKNKVIEVECCAECPKYKYNEAMQPYCELTNVSIDDAFKIQESCPLEDATKMDLASKG